MKVLPMNDQLFTQRRRVIAMLYEARDLLKIELPRIKVRLVDFEDDPSTLGMCFINKNYITISYKLDTWSDHYLRIVVWHELAHAYFNAPNVDGCPLMNAIISPSHSQAKLVAALKQCQKNMIRERKLRVG